jgi:hypothetical protein
MMRARVAYISSLGTTAILVAAALLMLAVVGAIVAFRGWPGAANGADVQSVPLTSPLTRASATLVATRTSHGGRGVVRAAGVAATKGAARLSTVGLVKQVGPGPLPGIVKLTTGGPGPSMHGVFPGPSRPIPSFPPPTGRNPVTVQLPPSSPGGGSSTLAPVELPNPAGAAPVTTQVGTSVGQVVTQVPSPPAVVESVRDVLPIH